MTANLSRMLTRTRYARAEDAALIDGATVVTHRELDDRVHAMAAALAAHDVRSGALVGILSENSVEYVVALFAISRLGAISVPMNTRLHAEELAYIVDHAGVEYVMASQRSSELATDASRRSTGVRGRFLLDGEDSDGWTGLPAAAARHEGAHVEDAHVDLDDPQRVLYTSGTTSRPKGVTITHGNVIFNHLTQITELGLTRRDRFLVSAPLYHVSALDAPGLTTIYLGGAMVLTPSFDATTMLEQISRHRVTGMILPGPVIRAMMEHPELKEFDLECVRWVVMASLPPGQAARFRDTVFPGAHMAEALGMTEYVSGIAYVPDTAPPTKTGSAGLPVALADVRVVRTSGDRDELPPGEAGEIVVRSPKVAMGYWRDPDATATAFRDGWLWTGDVGRVDDDGYIWFVDRLKHMIRSGGENIASAEIESVLARHPAVYEAAVVPAPDDRWGEVPMAFVVTVAGAQPTSDELVEHCRGSLARFKSPRYVVFVDELPHNHSGKVEKQVLRRRAAEMADG